METPFVAKQNNAFSAFTKAYLYVRYKENRILDPDQLKSLPYLKKHPLTKEWKKRARSFDFLNSFLDTQQGISNVLDLGCGNGWLTNHLAKKYDGVLGMDVNEYELEQARSNFNSQSLEFVFGDVFNYDFKNSFDLIVLSAAIQYFEEKKKLISHLKRILNPHGQIIILDSPIYRKEDLHKTKFRSKEYYTQKGVPEMADYYFPMIWDDLHEERFQVLHTPNFMSKLMNSGPVFPVIQILNQ